MFSLLNATCCLPVTHSYWRILQEDIGAQFGEQVAIHYYGATAEEQAELEKAALQDEEDEQRKRTSIGDKGSAHQDEVVLNQKT